MNRIRRLIKHQMDYCAIADKDDIEFIRLYPSPSHLRRSLWN